MNRKTVNRRRFIQAGLFTLGAVGTGLVRPPSILSLSKPDLTIAHGTDPYRATVKAIEMLGGIERFVKPGNNVILFPNIISPSPPQTAINTNPGVVAAVAENAGITKQQSNAVLTALADLAYKEAKSGFTLPGIGKLVLQKRKARMGRNPQTGEAIKIPAKTVVKFRIAKACKDAVLGG